MREHLFELSIAQLKDLYIHETKAITFALEAGVSWEDLKYIRDSLSDITRFIDAGTAPGRHSLNKKIGDNLPPFTMTPGKPL